jgi:hypothetical protein
LNEHLLSNERRPISAETLKRTDDFELFQVFEVAGPIRFNFHTKAYLNSEAEIPPSALRDSESVHELV